MLTETTRTQLGSKKAWPVDPKNRLIDFPVSEVYYPPQADVLKELFGNTVLQGRVVESNVQGADGRRFVAVQVEGVSEYLYVPVSALGRGL
jgi:hypothetical protein